MFSRFLIIACLIPNLSWGLCLKNCQQQTTNPAIDSTADSLRYRDRSHNTGDVKNSVMGDVNIQVGHKRLDIKMDSNSTNNSINASVSSTIILGDMKK